MSDFKVRGHQSHENDHFSNFKVRGQQSHEHDHGMMSKEDTLWSLRLHSLGFHVMLKERACVRSRSEDSSSGMNPVIYVRTCEYFGGFMLATTGVGRISRHRIPRDRGHLRHSLRLHIVALARKGRHRRLQSQGPSRCFFSSKI